MSFLLQNYQKDTCTLGYLVKYLPKTLLSVFLHVYPCTRGSVRLLLWFFLYKSIKGSPVLPENPAGWPGGLVARNTQAVFISGFKLKLSETSDWPPSGRVGAAHSLILAKNP